MRLEGQTALITGAGGGIGRACALALAKEGCHVGSVDKDPKSGQETVDEVRALGGSASFSQADVRDKGQVAAAVAGLVAARPRLDILVNCAGGGAGFNEVVDLPEETWDLVVGVNLKGTFLTCQAAARVMKAQKSGRIVNVASFIGFTGIARASDYAAAKGGVVAFTKSLALEMAPHGVCVNAIAPVTTETPLIRRIMSREMLEARAKTVPLGRLGQPEDMADSVLFLVSPESKFITGQTIHVNGGFVMY